MNDWSQSPTFSSILKVLSLLFLIFSFAGRSAFAEYDNYMTMKVKLKPSIPISVSRLAEYIRVVSVQCNAGSMMELGNRMEIGEGYRLEVEFTKKDGMIQIHARQPYAVPLSAPIYLGKKVAIESVFAKDLLGLKAIMTVPADAPQLVVAPNQEILCKTQDCQESDIGIALHFLKNEVYGRVPRPIGIQPIQEQTFELMDDWVSAGEDVRIKVPISNLNGAGSQLAVGFWSDKNNRYMEDRAYRAVITGIEPDSSNTGVYIVKARAPYLSAIEYVEPGWLSPVPPIIKMTVTVNQGNDGQAVSETFDLHFTRRGWGIAAGLLFIVLVLMVIMYITRDFNPFEPGSDRYTKWQATYKSRKFVRFFFSPLDIAVTPFGTYSISVSQALFWTLIVAFSCVYVYMLKAAFILIPAQILLLLGITGGTALASRINSTSRDEIPKELMIDSQRKDVPRLRDMISINGRPNIYKFQMMVFTIITGIIVVVELIKASNFPEIPESLIMLMGLSNTLYLGNEVAVEPVQGLREKVKTYKDEKDPIKQQQLGEEIKAMLSQY